MTHPSTFDYYGPTPEQVATMQRLRDAAKVYGAVLEIEIPEGPDKTFVIRSLRTVAMWANVAVTRQADGTPR